METPKPTETQLGPHINQARRINDFGVHGLDPRFEIVPDNDPRAQRGRFLAAMKLRDDPEQRRLVESIYGETYCRQRYPEAYERTNTIL